MNQQVVRKRLEIHYTLHQDMQMTKGFTYALLGRP